MQKINELMLLYINNSLDILYRLNLLYVYRAGWQNIINNSIFYKPFYFCYRGRIFLRANQIPARLYICINRNWSLFDLGTDGSFDGALADPRTWMPLPRAPVYIFMIHTHTLRHRAQRGKSEEKGLFNLYGAGAHKNSPTAVSYRISLSQTLASLLYIPKIKEQRITVRS